MVSCGKKAFYDCCLKYVRIECGEHVVRTISLKQLNSGDEQILTEGSAAFLMTYLSTCNLRI